MLVEVHAGSRPGNRILLAALCGLSLAVTLALAAYQSHSRTALGPEQRVGDTPLLVRLPRDWRPDEADRNSFILPIEKDSWRHSISRFERRLQIEYLPWGEFESGQRLVRRVDAATRRPIDALAAPVGPFDGVEIRKFDVLQIGPTLLRRQLIVRYAILPRGEMIRLEYEPLDALRPADLTIIDEVCASLRVDDATISAPASAHLEAAGFDFPVDPDWRVAGSAIPHVDAVYISGSVNRAPAWSIAMLRTWFTAGRTPRDLLADLAADEWLDFAARSRIVEEDRGDEAGLAWVVHPQLAGAADRLAGAVVLRSSASEGVVLLIYADDKSIDAALRTAQSIADEVRVAPRMTPDRLAEAEAAGRLLASRLGERGALPRWGREPLEAVYSGQAYGVEFVHRATRRAANRAPELGYRGEERTRFRLEADRTVDARASWSVDGRAAVFSVEQSEPYLRGRATVSERRASADADVEKHVSLDEQVVFQDSFAVDDRYVPPPVEHVIAGWVARGEAEHAIITTSGQYAGRPFSVSMRELAPQGSLRRVLVRRDSRPDGAILTFDDDRGLLERLQSPHVSYERRAPASPDD